LSPQKALAARPAQPTRGLVRSKTNFGVNQPHYCESRQSRCDLHLHVDAAGFDPFKGYRGNALDHAAPLPQRSVAEGDGTGKNIRGT
jgi:hypothetical protein